MDMTSRTLSDMRETDVIEIPNGSHAASVNRSSSFGVMNANSTCGIKTEPQDTVFITAGGNTLDNTPNGLGLRIKTEPQGTFVVEAGEITGNNTPTALGRRVKTETQGTFVMEAGENTENNTQTGLGQSVKTEPRDTFVMEAGETTEDNTPTGLGRRVKTESQGTFSMEAGKTTENNTLAGLGRRVKTEPQGTFVMEAGKITGINTPTGFGQRIKTELQSTFVMEAGETMENKTLTGLGQTVKTEPRDTLCVDVGETTEDNTLNGLWQRVKIEPLDFFMADATESWTEAPQGLAQRIKTGCDIFQSGHQISPTEERDIDVYPKIYTRGVLPPGMTAPSTSYHFNMFVSQQNCTVTPGEPDTNDLEPSFAPQTDMESTGIPLTDVKPTPPTDVKLTPQNHAMPTPKADEQFLLDLSSTQERFLNNSMVQVENTVQTESDGDWEHDSELSEGEIPMDTITPEPCPVYLPLVKQISVPISVTPVTGIRSEVRIEDPHCRGDDNKGNANTRETSQSYSGDASVRSPCPVSYDRNKTTIKKSTYLESFREPTALKRHMLKHTGKKTPYTCDICHQNFVRRCDLKRHKLTHTDEKTHSYDFWRKRLRNRSTLKTVMSSYTDVKPYSCDICDKSFEKEYFLNIHMRKHTGEKPYSCFICRKSFRKQGALKGHILTH